MAETWAETAVAVDIGIVVTSPSVPLGNNLGLETTAIVQYYDFTLKFGLYVPKKANN